eukprot:Colp12_sorted_trinity150504_noHs@17816
MATLLLALATTASLKFYATVSCISMGEWRDGSDVAPPPCVVMGMQTLAADARFATNELRVQHRDVLVPLLNNAFKAKPTAHWVQAFASSGIPHSPINNMEQVSGPH